MKNNNYDSLKKDYLKKDNKNNTTRFFSGLNEVLSIELYREKKKKKEIRQHNIIYTFRYAVIIFIIGLLLVLSISPIMRKIYIERKYQQLVYNELTFSYDDYIENYYDEHEYFVDDYLSISVNGFSEENISLWQTF